MMGKITLSDFIIALIDLLEAESHAFQDAAARFLQHQQTTLQKTLHRSGWMLAWIASAAGMLLAAIGFLTWGLYRLFAIHISETAAPFFTGGLLLIYALAFACLAKKMRSHREKSP